MGDLPLKQRVWRALLHFLKRLSMGARHNQGNRASVRPPARLRWQGAVGGHDGPRQTIDMETPKAEHNSKRLWNYWFGMSYSLHTISSFRWEGLSHTSQSLVGPTELCWEESKKHREWLCAIEFLIVQELWAIDLLIPICILARLSDIFFRLRHVHKLHAPEHEQLHWILACPVPSCWQLLCTGFIERTTAKQVQRVVLGGIVQWAPFTLDLKSKVSKGWHHPKNWTYVSFPRGLIAGYLLSRGRDNKSFSYHQLYHHHPAFIQKSHSVRMYFHVVMFYDSIWQTPRDDCMFCCLSTHHIRHRPSK
jgi:hypothetical protein